MANIPVFCSPEIFFKGFEFLIFLNNEKVSLRRLRDALLLLFVIKLNRHDKVIVATHLVERDPCSPHLVTDKHTWEKNVEYWTRLFPFQSKRQLWIRLCDCVLPHIPFSKMAAANSKWLKLNWAENQYQQLKDHLLFGNRTKFR